LPVVFTIKASDEFDDIAAGIASGKAVPNIFGKADNKGVGVVAAMNGTRAEELIASFFKRAIPAFVLSTVTMETRRLRSAKLRWLGII
jgi:hypothetical protein